VEVRVSTSCRQCQQADEAEPAAGVGRGALHDEDEEYARARLITGGWHA
jgi:hypothetical protein